MTLHDTLLEAATMSFWKSGHRGAHSTTHPPLGLPALPSFLDLAVVSTLVIPSQSPKGRERPQGRQSLRTLTKGPRSHWG